ncbi:hypothetical protein GMMP15_2050007 [Candidatus Magnetomoraceae bacterium gMMP-15]
MNQTNNNNNTKLLSSYERILLLHSQKLKSLDKIFRKLDNLLERQRDDEEAIRDLKKYISRMKENQAKREKKIQFMIGFIFTGLTSLVAILSYLKQ